MGNKENIFITWHYTTHGIAYLKHILSAFYKGVVKIENTNAEKIDQGEMNEVFLNVKNGFLFNKVYYLTANQNAFDSISTRRFNYKQNIINDQEIKDSRTLHIWEKIQEMNLDSIEQNIEFVKNQFANSEKIWMNQIWRDIQHYKISDQILWFKRYSNAHQNYKQISFEDVELNITDLRDTIQIAEKLKPFIDRLKSEKPDANYIINISLGSSETQVVWQVFSELNILPSNSKLIRTYDNKLDKEIRLKPFYIKEVPSRIVSGIYENFKIYEKIPESESRKLAELKMEYYINSGFSIFVLGERGIGKTRLAEKFSKKKNIISVNCASFTNNTIAESILFGYKKGAFTDAKEDRKGVLEEADKGILFLDEIHHLDKLVQAKLMKALQTDDENQLSIKRVGDHEERKVSTTIIFASNKNMQQLRENLLPDFYDRITQLVIELPPLRDSKEDLPQELENVWKQMKFDKFYDYKSKVGNDEKLTDWIKQLDLLGNYRDLQKIAIYYKTFLDFKDDIKEQLKIFIPYEFTKNEFERYISYNPDEIKRDEFFYENASAEKMIDYFQKKLAEWSIEKYGSANNASDHFKEFGGKTTKETLYNWKNKKIFFNNDAIEL